jgi:hypothetical protein
MVLVAKLSTIDLNLHFTFLWGIMSKVLTLTDHIAISLGHHRSNYVVYIYHISNHLRNHALNNLCSLILNLIHNRTGNIQKIHMNNIYFYAQIKVN